MIIMTHIRFKTKKEALVFMNSRLEGLATRNKLMYGIPKYETRFAVQGGQIKGAIQSGAYKGKLY